MTQTWVLICDQLLSRAAEHGTLFQLRQGDVSLLVTVRKMPHFNLTEEVIDPKTNKFVLRLNSETSVWWLNYKKEMEEEDKKKTVDGTGENNIWCLSHIAEGTIDVSWNV